MRKFLCWLFILVIGSSIAVGLGEASKYQAKMNSKIKGTLVVISSTGNKVSFDTRGIVKPTTGFVGRPYRYDFRDFKTGRKRTIIVSETDKVFYMRQ